VGSGPGGPTDEKAGEEVRTLFASIRDPVDPGLARDFQASTAYQPLPARFFETMTAELTRVPARVWHELAVSLTRPLAAERLKAIKVPTLVLWGDRDTLLTRKDQDALIGQIGGSRLIVYDATGHAPHWERPQRFAADLVAFVDGGTKPF
jgi:pimeloyl-ACP methyl ester carboxylesterase